jgi:hypothetical protein
MLLSILIPAYYYPEGVVRILQSASKGISPEVEILIFDDSPNDKVETSVSECGESLTNVRYVHNRPALGAANNWNALLDTAKGEYCLLMHHDEFPIGDCFVMDLVTTLCEHPETDVAMLDCVLTELESGLNRRHLPTFIRVLVVNYFPQYLFRRNVIGPTAALVIRRSIYPRFDARLQWLVDVDVYVRLLWVAKHLRFCPNIQIGSMQGRSDTITARLGSSIPRMAKEERTYLREQYPHNTLWLGPYPQEHLVYGLLRAFETLCWWSIRALTRLAVCIYLCPVPRSKVQRAVYGRRVQ